MFQDFPACSVVKNSPSNAGDVGSIPGQKLRSHMPWGQKQKQYCNTFNKDFKNGPHKKIFKNYVNISHIQK